MPQSSIWIIIAKWKTSVVFGENKAISKNAYIHETSSEEVKKFEQRVVEAEQRSLFGMDASTLTVRPIELEIIEN